MAENGNNAARLVELWGGLRPLARDLGVNASLVSRWVHKYRAVPVNWRARVLKAARARGPGMAANVEPLLPAGVCECCGQPVGAHQ